MNDYVFESAEEALKWEVEVLRRRHLPKTSPIWREIEAEAEWVGRSWEGGKNLSLPTGGDERMHLAGKVMEALERAGVKDAGLERILRLWALGDWADDGRLNAALAIQEKCRREGIRVRLAYRYTYEQLGVALGCDRKTAWRKVQDGLAMVGEELLKQGLLEGVEAPARIVDNFKKDVYSDDFKR